MGIQTLLTIIINGPFLLITFVLTVIMLQTIVQYQRAFGDGEKQTPLRDKFLKLLLVLILLGFLAAIANIIIAWL